MKKKLIMRDIAESAAAEYGVAYYTLIRRGQTDDVSKPRHVAQYLSRLYTHHSYQEIANFFAQSSPGAPRSAYEKVAFEYEKYEEVAIRVNNVIERIKQRGFAMQLAHREVTEAGVNGPLRHDKHCPTCGKLSPLTGKCSSCTPKYNEKEWSQFINKSIGGYMSTALTYTKSFMEAQDIVWGVFSKLLEKDYHIDDRPYVGLKAVHNASLGHVRHRSYRYTSPLNEEIVSDRGSIEKQIDVEYMMSNLSSVLSEKEEDVLTSYINGMPYKDMAIKHNLPLGTIKSCVHGVKKKMRNEYPEYIR